MQPKKRYVQPQTVREAMETIQKLFNSYRHAPLTQDLLNYHINLTNRLQTDIYVAALREKKAKQLEDLKAMTEAMQTWTKIRSENKPFIGKMKNFRLTSNNGTKFKQHVHKIKGNHSYRGVKH
ncbi:hypothetical protein AB0X60_04430 [Ligilactobacillus salivarius]|uniref:hypothetical protein n=1 Tax=Ligilactobacillus salivarius TaxID=1624 RepID=UPI003F22063A